VPRDHAPDPAQRSDSSSANVAQLTRMNREHTDSRAQEQWAAEEITWGAFGVPDTTLGSPLGEVAGLDIVELGCGTAYFSAWLARRGGRPVGVDPTPAQLETARRMQARGGPQFPLLQAPAERVPLPDASFELALSEYGASLWADPKLWVPEASAPPSTWRPPRLPDELGAAPPLLAR